MILVSVSCLPILYFFSLPIFPTTYPDLKDQISSMLLPALGKTEHTNATLEVQHVITLFGSSNQTEISVNYWLTPAPTASICYFAPDCFSTSIEIQNLAAFLNGTPTHISFLYDGNLLVTAHGVRLEHNATYKPLFLNEKIPSNVVATTTLWAETYLITNFTITRQTPFLQAVALSITIFIYSSVFYTVIMAAYVLMKKRISKRRNSQQHNTGVLNE